MAILVQKFGGTSIADIEKIRAAAEIAVREASSGHDVTAVVSAMGRSSEQLVSMANQISPQPNQRELDMLLSTGDQVAGALMSMAIQSLGWSAKSYTGAQAGIVTEVRNGVTCIKDVQPNLLESGFERGEIAVVAGMQGIAENSEITTLGLGRSDTTAIALAAALGADRCDVYTDVNGVFTADPNVVGNARCLPALSYEEMMEMASAGADILSHPSIELAFDAQVPVRVRATHRPDDLGTLVTNRTMTTEKPICAVALDLSLASIALRTSPCDPDDPASEKQLVAISSMFTRLQELNINTDMMMLLQREDEPCHELTMTVPKGYVKRVISLIESLKNQLGNPKLKIDNSLARISVVGRYLASRPDAVASIFDTLSEHSIPVQMVSTTDMRVSILLPDTHAVRAVNLIHSRFNLQDSGI